MRNNILEKLNSGVKMGMNFCMKVVCAMPNKIWT